MLLSRQFMKIFCETRLCEILRKLINLICNKIVNSCWWCEIKLFDDKMRYLWKNFFSRLFDFIIRVYILSYLDLQSSIFQFFDSQMKIVQIENQHDDFEEDSIVVHCWREEFDIQKLILICFELRTLFNLRNRETSTIKRCFRYLNKTMKIKFELRMLLHLCLKKKKSRNYRDASISLKRRQNFKIIKMLLYLLKNQLLTKVDFKKCLQSSS